jgi:16S rRNA (cytidine1402-2'-O)-methyltransferase
MTSVGTLWLVPNALDLGCADPTALTAVLPLGALQRAAALRHWVVESAKPARAFLARVNEVEPLAQGVRELQIAELPRAPKDGRAPPEPAQWHALLAPALAGHDVGLLSDAGLPGVADPGAHLVAAAHDAGVPVRPLAGPSSVTLALAASGLAGQQFCFVGYLPQDGAARAARVRALEAASRAADGPTAIAIETPYRNAALAAALLQALQPATRLAIAHGLTLDAGWCLTRTVHAWRERPPDFGPRPLPAVFCWRAG